MESAAPRFRVKSAAGDSRAMVDSISQGQFRATLSRAVATPILAMLIAAGVFGWQLSRLIAAQEWVDHTDIVISRTFEMQKTNLAAESGLRAFQLSGDQSYLQAYRESSRELESAMGDIRLLTIDNARQTPRIDEIRELTSRWQSFADQRETLLALDREVQSRKMLEGRELMTQINALSTTMLEEERTLRKIRLGAAQDTAKQVVWISSAVTLLLAGFLGWLARRQLLGLSGSYSAALETNERQTRTLRTATDAYSSFVERVAGGDFTSELRLEEEDPQLKRLGENLVVMVKTLRTMAARVSEAATALGQSTARILTTTQQLSAGATESSAAVTETMAAVDEVAQTSSGAKERARNVAEASRRSVDVSNGGRGAVQSASAAMAQVKTQVDSIAERILALSEQAQAVGQIITTVNELAEQSNLLALNAAIEAARAGEHGRSFAIVAQEVRTLAEHSKRATSQVRAILGDIQKSTSNAVLATEEGNKAVSTALRTVADTGNRIEQLADVIRDAADAASQIDASSEQQARGMDQISQAMRAIGQATSQSVMGTQQSEQAAHELSALSDRMREAVSQYRY